MSEFKFESKLEQEVLDAMQAAVPLDWAKCGEIAEKFGLKQRTIQTTATRLDMPYKRKEKAAKSGAKVESKSDIVSEIAQQLSVEVDVLEGLDKSTKMALCKLRDLL